jgi:TfoX/Sxy family transcriptional regulator of competence genes
MQWRRPDEQLVGLLAEAMRSFVCQKRVMFGCPAYFANDNMFTGVFADSIYLRLPETERLRLLAEQPEATVFEPMPGRPMKEYVSLPPALTADGETLAAWLERAYDYALSLPPRAGKAARRK